MPKLKITAEQRKVRQIWKASARRARKAGISVPLIKDLPMDYNFTLQEARQLDEATETALQATRNAEPIIEVKPIEPAEKQPEKKKSRYDTEEKRRKHAEQQRAYRERKKNLSASDKQLLALAKEYGLTAVNTTNLANFKEYLLAVGAISENGHIYWQKVVDALQEIQPADDEEKSANQIFKDFMQYQKSVIDMVQNSTEGYSYYNYVTQIKKFTSK